MMMIVSRVVSRCVRARCVLGRSSRVLNLRPMLKSMSPALRMSSSSASSSDPESSAHSEAGSHDGHRQGADDEQRVRTRILERALVHVGETGWSTDALRKGCLDEGMSASAHAVFERGPIELVYFFMDQTHENMTHKMHDMPLKDLRQLAILREAIKYRLECIQPYLVRWPQAIALGAMPMNAATTSTRLGQLVDDIWHLAGDRSTDMDWYARRAALLAVYTSTELYMLTDRSAGYKDTWKFLENNLQQMSQASTLPDQISRYASNAGALAFQSLASIAARFPFPMPSPASSAFSSSSSQHPPPSS